MANNPMYHICIENYWGTKVNPQTGQEEPYYYKTRHTVYDIPITDSESAFIDPVIRLEMGKAGSFEFSVAPNNPWYNKWLQMKTIVHVDFNGENLFRGRVITVDKSPFTGIKKIHCEGDLAFLLDSQQELTHEEQRKEITVSAYIEQILEAHNEQMWQAPEGERKDKTIYAGEIPGKYSSSIKKAQKVNPPKSKYGSSSWENSMSALEALSKEYGGYFRTRYATDSQSGEKRTYLDWLDNFFRPDINSESMEVTKNLIDLSGSTQVDNIFTVLIPIGSKNGKELFLKDYKYEYKDGSTTKTKTWTTKYMTVPDIYTLYQQGAVTEDKINVGYYHSLEDYRDAIKNYNIIYKTQKFENADTQEKLWNYAIEWIANNYIGTINNFTVSALDLYHYDPETYTSRYLVGDRVRLIFPEPDDMDSEGHSGRTTLVRTILSIEYHLHNPEQNSYSIGAPSNILNKKYGTSNNKKTQSGNHDTEEEKKKKKLEATVGEVDSTLWDIVWNAYFNNDKYKDYDADEVNSMITTQYIFLKNAKEDHNGVDSIVLDGINGGMIFQEDDPISPNVRAHRLRLGKFGYDPETGHRWGMELLNGGAGEEATVANLSSELTPEAGTGATLELNVVDENGNINPSFIANAGEQLLQTFQQPESGQTPSTDPVVTSELNGSDGSASMGGHTDSSGKQAWRVKLSKPFTYTGPDGQQHTTADGTISAEDFSLVTVPSFSADFAFIHTIVTEELVATIARVENLVAEDIDATHIHTEKIGAKRAFFNSVRITESTGSSYDGSITAANFVFRDHSDSVSLQNCLFGMSDGYPKVDENGVVTFRFTRANGLSPLDVTFNQADTLFYKNGVSAAHNAGGATAYMQLADPSKETPDFEISTDATGLKDFQIYYTDANGNAALARTLTGHVTGGGGGGGTVTVSVDDMEWNESNNRYRTKGHAYSDGTEVATTNYVSTPKITAAVDEIKWSSTNSNFYTKGHAKGGSTTLDTTEKEESKTVTLDVDSSWSSGSKSVTVKHGTTTILSDSVSIPKPTDCEKTVYEFPGGYSPINDEALWISSYTKSIIFKVGGKGYFIRVTTSLD